VVSPVVLVASAASAIPCDEAVCAASASAASVVEVCSKKAVRPGSLDRAWSAESGAVTPTPTRPAR
jgi:hypothetical protein